MNAVVVATASVLGAFSGMALLCLQSPAHRHRNGLPEQDLPVRLGVIVTGAVLLYISLFAAVTGQGASFGIVAWMCQLGLLGLAMIILLPYFGPHIMQAARAAAVASPAALIAAHYV